MAKKKVDPASVANPTSGEPEPTGSPSANLSESAFTLHKNGDTYEVVEVAFDYASGEAKVVKRVPASRHLYKGIDAHKLVMGKYLQLKFGMKE